MSNFKKEYTELTGKSPYAWNENGKYVQSASYSDGYVKFLEKKENSHASKELYQMNLLEVKTIFVNSLDKTVVKKVPGGWLFYNNSNSDMVFVPYNDEFAFK